MDSILQQVTSVLPDNITLPKNIKLPESVQSIGGAVAIVCATTLGLLTLKYHDRAIFTERPKGIPFESGAPLFGSLFEQIKFKDTVHDATVYMMEKHDTMTFGMTALGIPVSILTINPANIEYVLKTNFANYIKGQESVDNMEDLFGHGIFVIDGEKWRNQRKTASLIFNVSNFRDHFCEVFIKEFDVMAENIFDKKALSGKPVDFHDVIYKYTLDSFVDIGFGKKLNSLLTKEKVPFARSFDVGQRMCSDRFIDPMTDLYDALKPLLHPGTMRMKDHIKVVDDFTYSLIRDRREQIAQGGEFKDLLSRFMTSRNEHGEALNDKELRDMVLNFIIAGRDTTAQALSWAFFLLLNNPRVEEKLMTEINQYLPDEKVLDAAEYHDTIKSLTYAHAVFYETLRLYPSVPSNGKQALEDDVLPDGAHVKKGQFVLWSPYAQGRSTKVWGPDAKEFKPERWIQEDGKLKRESQGKFAAFHGGPRVCLGQHLATLEALIAMTSLLKRYKFKLVPGQHVTYEASLTCPMKTGMKVTVERR
ncbi:cytochrome P450 [Phascolomyces articulosus]|uniref:Cytochrome P450 n=1 Tax=Phascolomyces articulosus TaxID=60185 RepID=A0AAD5K3T2_9FUNG|nr:cytochrome P450 [Phascolomyces articulosus]